MLEQTTTVPDSKSVLTIVEIARSSLLLSTCLQPDGRQGSWSDHAHARLPGRPKAQHGCMGQPMVRGAEEPVIRSGSCQDYSPHSQERENAMRRIRFVRGCLAPLSR